MRSKQDCDCSAPEATQKAIDNGKTPRWISNLHLKHFIYCAVSLDEGGEKYSVSKKESMRGKQRWYFESN